MFYGNFNSILTRTIILGKWLPLLTIVTLLGCHTNYAQLRNIQKLQKVQTTEKELITLIADTRGDVLQKTPSITLYGNTKNARPQKSQGIEDTLLKTFPLRLLKAFHILPMDFQLPSHIASINLNNHAIAEYDLQTKTITIDPQIEIFDGLSASLSNMRRKALIKQSNQELEQHGLGFQNRVLIHELVHALQDQEYSITTQDLDLDSIDRQLAWLSVLEGDATFTTWDIAHKALGINIVDVPNAHQTLKQIGIEELLSPKHKLLPAPLQYLSAFPYYQGAGFIANIVRTGGYSLLHEVYANPPITTAQIIHPDQYARGFSGLIITPPENFTAFPTIHFSEFDSLGEARLAALLTGWEVAACHSQAASVWQADRVFLLSNPQDKLLGALLVIAYDSESKKESFLHCLQEAQALPEDIYWESNANLISISVGLHEPLAKKVIQYVNDTSTVMHGVYRPALSTAIRHEPTATQAAMKYAPHVSNATSNVDDGWFIHPGLKLRIPIPEKWQAITNHPNSSLIPLILENNQDKSAITFIVVANTKQSSLLAIAGETVAALSGRFPDISVVQEEQVLIACGNSYQALFQYKNQDHIRRGYLTIVISENLVYSIVSTYPKEKEEQSLTTTNAVIRSMQCGTKPTS